MTTLVNFLKDVTHRPIIVIVYFLFVFVYTISMYLFDLSTVMIISVDFLITVVYLIAGFNVYDDGYEFFADIPGHLLTVITAIVAILLISLFFHWGIIMLLAIELSVIFCYIVSAKILYVITDPNKEINEDGIEK